MAKSSSAAGESSGLNVWTTPLQRSQGLRLAGGVRDCGLWAVVLLAAAGRAKSYSQGEEIFLGQGGWKETALRCLHRGGGGG